jgi:hypothetical protein
MNSLANKLGAEVAASECAYGANAAIPHVAALPWMNVRREKVPGLLAIDRVLWRRARTSSL